MAGPAQPLLQDVLACEVLHMDMQPDEDCWMSAIGAARAEQPAVHSCELLVSPRVCPEIVAENLKLLFIFDNLRHLQLRLGTDDVLVTQRMVCALAELLHLTSLHVLQGSIQPAVDISHWSSLHNLAELKLLPYEQAGLLDQQLEQLSMLSSSLTSLSLRLDPSHITAAGTQHLARLATLRQLSLCPMGQKCTAAELQRLLELPQLSDLTLGVTRASDVLLFSQVQLPASLKLSLRVLDTCSSRLTGDVLSVMSWCLPQHLVRLTVGPLIAACPGDVLLMLATLTRLQELKLQVTSPLEQHIVGTLDLLALKPLQQLTCLELLTTTRLYMPITVKTVSLLSVAWQKLASLTLSVTGKPEVMPEALGLLDNFTGLTALQLLSPLDQTLMDEAYAASAAASADAGAGMLSAGDGSGSWTDWALSGLQDLGLIRSGSSSAGGTQSGRTHAGAPASSSVIKAAARMSTTRSPNADSPAAGSPLARDLRQRILLQQQHKSARQQSRHSTSLGAPSTGHAGVTAQHVGRSQSLDVASSSKSVWNMFGACQAMYASSKHPLHTSLSMPEQRHSSSSWSDSARASGASEQPQAAEYAAPAGLEMAMYRASGKLVPINLQYLPRSLQRLCLESYHVLSGEVVCSQQQNQQAIPPNTASDILLQPQQQQQIKDVVHSGSHHAGCCSREAAHGTAAQGMMVPAGECQHALHAELYTMQQPGNSNCCPGSCSSSSSSRLRSPVLSNLTRLELEGCRIDDNTFKTIVNPATGLRTLELAGVEGLTDEGIACLSKLSQLTRLVVEAEASSSITLTSFSTISQLITLEQLHWCSRDSIHGPVDVAAVTAQLCALTRLKQLVFVSQQEQWAARGSSWEHVLYGRLPLCRVLLRPHLEVKTPWGNVPDPK